MGVSDEIERLGHKFKEITKPLWNKIDSVESSQGSIDYEIHNLKQQVAELEAALRNKIVDLEVATQKIVVLERELQSLSDYTQSRLMSLENYLENESHNNIVRMAKLNQKLNPKSKPED